MRCLHSPYTASASVSDLHIPDNVKEYLWSLGIGEKTVLHIYSLYFNKEQLP